MDQPEVEITISVDAQEAAEMTYGQRERWLGKLAEAQLAEAIPPRPPKSGYKKRDGWMPYTRKTIAAAFAEWSRLHDGKAPSKADWSHGRDPERRWPRPHGESFSEVIAKLAAEDGISLKRTAPCRDDPEQQARIAWHEAQHARKTADGRLEREGVRILGSRVDLVERWEPADFELGEDPGRYCAECFHGSGCRPADISPWQYAVEEIGGLRLRGAADFHATPSRRDEYGRNRQMVTGGVFAAPDVIDIDPSVEGHVR
jgi:hypothetical protein